MLVSCGVNRREFLQNAVVATARLSLQQTSRNSSERSKKALDAIRSVSIATREPDKEDEVFDFRHYFSLPVSLNMDRLVYGLVLTHSGGGESHPSLEIPLLRYEQKTKLIFPIKGKFLIGLGHDFNEQHSDGRSQHFAYDILGAGPHWEITRNGGTMNTDIYGWGREVIAPADATSSDAGPRK